MTEDNMVNRLAGLQRDNIKALFQRHELSMVAVAKLTGLSSATVRNTFGKTVVTAPSKKTLAAIYRLFDGLTVDCLDVYNSVEKIETTLNVPDDEPEEEIKEEEVLPVRIKMKSIRLQIDRTVIESEVSEELAKKLVDLLIYGEDEV